MLMNYSQIRIMYYDSKEIVLDTILWGLIGLDCQVERSTIITELDNFDPDKVDTMTREMADFDYVISQNFNVNVAEAAHNRGIPYISWIYDSPQLALYLKEALYDTNYVFAFDKMQVKRLTELGIPHVYYMPLAANMGLVSTLKILPEDEKKYKAELSFVGQFYRHDYFAKMANTFPAELVDRINEVAKKCALAWNREDTILGGFDEKLVSEITPLMKQSAFDKYNIDKGYSEEVLLLAPLVASIERREMINRASLVSKTKVYTKENDIEFARENTAARVFGPVDASTALKIYYASKLNLNLTLKTIETGVPQRIFDIMGVGGTVISDYREEMEELFVPDKEIILFHSPEEMEDKLKFYLRNDKACKKIGVNGYKRVSREYNLVDALAKILNTVGGEA